MDNYTGILLITVQRLLAPVAQARKVINRKRFLGEHERTVNNFTGRLNAEQ
ncbi:MAG: hypothetical protein FWC60_07035 [Firmicutes bacterium]|nr:hypothetical protein [Bacillota bacterium]